MQVMFPKGMLGSSASDDALDAAMRTIGVAASPEPDSEWAEKYGTNTDNEVFMMHRFCWCEKDDCPWCGGEITPELMKEFGFDKEQETAPNFWYKPLDFKVWWYKYIGRGMETNMQLSALELSEMVTQCLKAVQR